MNSIKTTIIVLFGVLLVPLGVFAQNALSVGYQSDNGLKPATLVSLSSDDPTKVVPASLSLLDNLVGVVAAESDSLVEIESSAEQIAIVTSGTTLVFVSTIGGDILPGDYLTASPLNGVAMKADKEDIVVGRSQVAFNASSEDYIEREISGELQNLGIGGGPEYLGIIPVNISIGDNPSNIELSGIAGFAQQITESLTDSGVSPVRLLIVLLIFLITASFLITLLYGAITGSITSIGRNPLVKGAIFNSMYRVIGLSLIILAAMILVVYLILN